MKLTDLIVGQKVILQLVWGDQKIEFHNEVLEISQEGIYVDPYIHNGSPLEFQIGLNSKVVCNIFADDPENGNRISWKNLDLKTEKADGNTRYFLKTKTFGLIAKLDDRRKYERMVVQKKAELIDRDSSEHIEIVIFDISDMGVSFYAPISYTPPSNRFHIQFTDMIESQIFTMKIDCESVRSKEAVGMMFYGCRILKENKDYILYGCMKRLERKKRKISLFRK